MEKVYKYYEIVASEGYYRVSIDTVSHTVSTTVTKLRLSSHGVAVVTVSKEEAVKNT